MDRVSLAFIRLFFFLMLFVSSACNKMDHTLLKEDFGDAKPAVAAQPAAQTEADAARLRELEGRVSQLEAELKTVNHEARYASDIPGGANWD
ncbi:hypothetical protein [Humidesulfovibrio idahonensis]